MDQDQQGGQLVGLGRDVGAHDAQLHRGLLLLVHGLLRQLMARGKRMILRINLITTLNSKHVQLLVVKKVWPLQSTQII